VPVEIQQRLNFNHCNCYVEFHQLQVSNTPRKFKAKTIITNNQNPFALHCRLAKIGPFVDTFMRFSVLQNAQKVYLGDHISTIIERKSHPF